MGGKNDVAISSQQFEGLKQINKHGAEYWSARAIQALLGYSQWRRFEKVIERAVSSCKESRSPAAYQFAGVGKLVWPEAVVGTGVNK